MPGATLAGDLERQANLIAVVDVEVDAAEQAALLSVDGRCLRE
jgi:hypothetical protein